MTRHTSYSGSTTVRMDAKNRFILPAPLRRVAEAEDGSGNFQVSLGGTGSLVMYTSVGWDEHLETLKAGLKRIRDAGKLRRAKKSYKYLIQRATPVGMGQQGRICLPADLLEKAGIKEEVLVVGNRENIEIWDPEAYAAYFAEVADDLEEFYDTIEDLEHEGSLAEAGIAPADAGDALDEDADG